ncbi:hypothetical protein D3C81_1993020 [compost metagenome]
MEFAALYELELVGNLPPTIFRIGDHPRPVVQRLPQVTVQFSQSNGIAACLGLDRVLELEQQLDIVIQIAMNIVLYLKANRLAFLHVQQSVNEIVELVIESRAGARRSRFLHEGFWGSHYFSLH